MGSCHSIGSPEAPSAPSVMVVPPSSSRADPSSKQPPAGHGATEGMLAGDRELRRSGGPQSAETKPTCNGPSAMSMPRTGCFNEDDESARVAKMPRWLGAQLLDTDKMMRSLRIRERAENMDREGPTQRPGSRGGIPDGNHLIPGSTPAGEFDGGAVPSAPRRRSPSELPAKWLQRRCRLSNRTVLTDCDQLGLIPSIFDLDAAPGVMAKGERQAALAAADWKDLKHGPPEQKGPGRSRPAAVRRRKPGRLRQPTHGQPCCGRPAFAFHARVVTRRPVATGFELYGVQRCSV